MRRNTIGLALGALLLAAGPAVGDTGDTGDTGEARDTAPYEDTGAVSESVYLQDVGCAATPGGPGAAGAAGLALLSLCAGAAWGRRARGRGPARSR